MAVRGLVVFLVAVSYADGQLKWSESYILKANITVPGANIIEPYQVWVDGDSQNSRIDFYGGMDKLYRIWDELREKYVYYKINPEASDLISRDTCHMVDENLAEIKAILRQTYLPVKNFKFVSYEDMGAFKAHKYEVIDYNSRWNWSIISTIWVRMKDNLDGAKTIIPLKYVYESKIGNTTIDYFDHIYTYFLPVKPSEDVLQLPVDLDCQPLLGSTFQSDDPLMEYEEPAIGYNKTTKAFYRFTKRHNKIYKDAEHDTRMHIFMNNLRFIESENRKQKSYKLGITQFADLSDEEMGSIILGSHHHNVNDHYDVIHDKMDDYSDYFESFDWRERGAVTPVKDQTTLCGSCYAFITAAAIESALYIFRGETSLEEISEQAILDCTPNGPQKNAGCFGGLYEYSLMWIHKYGIPTKKEYGPYLAMEGKCLHRNMTRIVNVPYFNRVASNIKAIKKSLHKYGPLIASVDGSRVSFAFYLGGIYNDPNCRSEPNQRTHGVIIVGYGKERDEEYWILKNSFGTGWGEDGYMRLSMRDNRCGIMNYVYKVKAESNDLY